jgi:YVTN family beta-propeller protein
MRTTARLATAVVLAAAVAACGEPRVERPDTLFLQSRRGVTIVPAGGASPSFQASSALPSHDWSKVVQTERVGHNTRVVGFHPSTEIELWSQIVPGNLKLKAVSRDADLAVLEPAGSRYASNPTVTKFVIARRGADSDIIELDGNFAPEAFSTDGNSLFVVQYFPARNPNRYQVRRLDLTTGKVNDVYSVDAELQRAMRGTARVQAMSPDGTRLYTLYTLKRAGRSYAFVHVLSLAEDELWAHCIDLPASFSRSAQSATALALAPDGKHLYVANTHTDVVAEVDTERLAVTRTVAVDLDEGERAYATYAADSTLLVASGWKVVAIGVRNLDALRSWKMLLPVTGIQGGGGTKLYVGQAQRIAILDRASGKRLGEVDPPGIGTITRLGKVTRGLDSVRTEIVCAC